MKSAHHTNHKNVGLGCSTNAKVILINIISIELMTSSARDASCKPLKHQWMMEIWSYEFCNLRRTSFTFPFDMLCSCSLKTKDESLTSFLWHHVHYEISHLLRWQVVSFWHFPPNFQKLPAWKDSLLWHNSLLLEQVVSEYFSMFTIAGFLEMLRIRRRSDPDFRVYRRPEGQVCQRFSQWRDQIRRR